MYNQYDEDRAIGSWLDAQYEDYYYDRFANQPLDDCHFDYCEEA